MSQSVPHIVIVGGGFGGLETAFYLRRRLKERAAITLISDQDTFLFKPNTIYIPFGLAPEKLLIPLAKPLRNKQIGFIHARVRAVQPDKRHVITEDDQHIAYDYLVLASGASMRPSEIPGMSEHAYTIWTPQEMLRLREALQQLARDVAAGQERRVLFLVPPNNKCAGPLYEMVYMVDTWLRQRQLRPRVTLTWTTYEQSYIQAFGPRLHTVAFNEFERRHIHHHPDYVVEAIEPNAVRYRHGGRERYDMLITFPPYIASTHFDTLPVDERGFIRAQLETRQVEGYEDIYVAGDGGDFPIKQAFLAFLQADAIAEHLSARILDTAPQHLFQPVSMCVMEQFDKATFAQVPLVVNGTVSVQTESPLYRVGTGALWRLGKKLLGWYLPWRFGAGEPFHAGLPWKGMEIGLKWMSGVLAS